MKSEDVKNFFLSAVLLGKGLLVLLFDGFSFFFFCWG